MVKARCIRRSVLAATILLASAGRAWAQQEIDATSVYLGPSGTVCLMSTGSGDPSGGTSCDFYADRSTGNWWRKLSGNWTIVGTVKSITGLSGLVSWSLSSSGVVTASLDSQSAALTFASPPTTSGAPTMRTLANAHIAGAGAACTKADDTNVTLTLGGSASTGCVNATSWSMGWAGRLALSRFASAGAANTLLQGGTGDSSYTDSPTVREIILSHATNPFARFSKTNSVAQNWDLNGGDNFSITDATAAFDALTFTKGTGAAAFHAGVSAPAFTDSGLTSGRVVIAGSGGLLGDDADLTFATDTLTATKEVSPTSVTTPAVYGYGSPYTLSLGGTGATCGAAPNCESIEGTFKGGMVRVRPATTPAIDARLTADAEGARVSSANSGAWAKLWLEGAPVQVGGGGLHVGTNSVTDPGLGNTALDGYIGTPNYVSGTSGWRCTYEGACDMQLLTANELIVKTFTADLEQALAGGQFITKSVAPLAADFLVPSKGSIATLTVKDFDSAPGMAVFVSGDVIRVRTMSRANGGLIVADAYGTVSSYVDNGDKTQSWQFMRLLGNDGGSLPGASVTASANSLVLDYGVSGNGYIESTAIDGTATITTLTRSSSTATATTTAPHGLKTGDSVVISGATGSQYNGVFTITVTSSTAFTYTVSGTPTTPDPSTSILVNGTNGTNAPYQQMVTWGGLSPQPANLTPRTRIGNLRGITGTLEYGALLGTYTGSATDKYLILSDQQATIHNLALSIQDATNTKIILNPTTPYISVGNPASTAYGSGSGFWAGLDGGCAKVHIGDYSSNYIDWNCSQMTVSGNIVVTGTSIDASTVNGYSGASVVSASQRGLLGLDSNGNPILPHTATPSGSGLFLGSDYMGYFTASAWKTYIDSNGNFAFGNVGGGGAGISWTQATATLSIKGSVTITAGTGFANLSDKPTALSDINGTEGTKLTGIEAGATVTATHTAADVTNVNGVAAATVQGGAAKANLGLDASGYVVTKVIPATAAGACSGSAPGLYLGSDYLGYCDGTRWRVYMDAAAHFSLLNASGTAALGFDGTSLTVVGDGAGMTNIDGGNIQTGTITASAIAANTITTGKIAAHTIDAGNIAAGTITATEIAANTITTGNIAAHTIDAGNIAAGTITATEIAAATITAGKLSITSLSAIAADLGAVTAGSVVVGSSNKLWLNDSADGVLAVGGSSKSAAPTRVEATGEFRAGYAGANNYFKVATSGAVSISAYGHGYTPLSIVTDDALQKFARWTGASGTTIDFTNPSQGTFTITVTPGTGGTHRIQMQDIEVDSVVSAGTVKGTGYQGHDGTSGSNYGSYFNVYWTGACAELWIDTTRLGCINVTPAPSPQPSLADLQREIADLRAELALLRRTQ